MSLFTSIAVKTCQGVIDTGLGVARGNLAAQLPKIAMEFSAVGNCHAATINVNLKQPLRIIKPDYTTQPIEWMLGVVEQFSLTEAQLECPIDGPCRKVWIYGPSLSPHRFSNYYVEILAPIIIGISKDMPCRLHILQDKCA